MNKVKISACLAQAKPMLKKLLDELLQEYEYASVLMVDATGKRYNVSKSGTMIAEDRMFGDFGVVIKVYDKKGYAEYSFNRLTEEEVSKCRGAIAARLIPLSEKLPEGLTKSSYGQIADEACTLSESTEYEIHPTTYGDDKIIAKLTEISEKGRAADERILNCSVGFQYQEYTKIFLSKHKDMTESVLWCTGSIFAAASSGEKVENSFQPFSVSGGAELLDTMEHGLDRVIKTTIELLSSETIVPGEYDCICTPEVTGMIVHEAFGHGVEMDMFVKDRALAQSYIGEYVASPLVTMHDGACAAKETATYFFDDEGTLAHDTVVIDKGILKRGISDMQTAMHLKTEPTGNGRRQDHSRKAYTRMTNTYFEAGTDKLEDMIASISYGFMLQEATSGMEDPKNWGIQCMVSIAREIKDGKFTGKLFSPIVLTGYVPDLLKSISMVSDDFALSGSGYCGKGYKEWVKVSDGGPYIKARIRLG